MLLEAVKEFQGRALSDMLNHGIQGISPYRTFLANGQDQHLGSDQEWLRVNWRELEQVLQRP